MGNSINFQKHYQLKQDSVVGKGGLATVYKAKNPKTRRSVAVKRQTKPTVCSELTPHALSGMIQEAQILAEVAELPESEDHFLQLQEAYYDKEGRMCLVTEYLPGRDLAKVVGTYKKGVPEYRVKYYMRQILEGLEILHSHNIAHLDLKLENIFVQVCNKVKLIDFGFAAKTCRHNWETGENEEIPLTISRGSLHYVCPEVAAYKPCFGKKADIWALGIITYALLTGKFPFNAKSREELFSLITVGNYQPPAKLSAEGLKFLQRMLAADPNERASVKELLADQWISSRTNVF